MSQFLKINLSKYISYWVYFSGEPWLQQQVTLDVLQMWTILSVRYHSAVRMLSRGLILLHLTFFLHISSRLLPFTPHERKCVIFGYHDVRNKFTGDGAEDSFTIQDCLKLWEDGEWDDKNETEANRPANEAQLRKWEGLSKFLSGKVYGNFSLYSPLGTSFLCVVAVVENTKAIWLQKMVLWRYR